MADAYQVSPFTDRSRQKEPSIRRPGRLNIANYSNIGTVCRLVE